MAKLPVILGNLDVTVDNVSPDVISKVYFNHFLFCVCDSHHKQQRALKITNSAFVCHVYVLNDGICFAVLAVSLSRLVRLCHLLLHPCASLWGKWAWASVRDRGVRTLHRKVLAALHHLQQSSLLLPQTPQIRQPEVLCEGKTPTSSLCEVRTALHQQTLSFNLD